MRRVDPTGGVGGPGDATGVASPTVVRAGGAPLLDRALELAVGPAVAEVSATWSFVRWVDAAGPQLRIDVRDADPDVFRRAVVLRLGDVVAAEPREPVLPPPASQRGTTGWAVEPLADAAEVPWGAVDHAVCTAVVDALRVLGDGTERLAFALAAVRAVPGAAELDWSGVARDLAGGGDRAERAVERLGRRAADLASELERRAAGFAGDAADALSRIGAALTEGDDATSAAGHAHLLCNRLGVNPLEEIVLALVLADGDGVGATPGDVPAADRGTARFDGPAGEDGATPTDGPADEDGTHPADDDGAPDDVRTAEDATDHPDAEPPAPGEPRRRKAAVRLRGVSEEADGALLLDDVSLTVRRGEVLGVLCDDARTRSTVLALATGRRHPTTGRVRVLGRDPRAEHDAVLGDVGVPESDEALSPGLTVRENVEALAHGAADAAVEDALRRTGLLDDAGRRVEELGPGHRRRTGLACALARGVAVLGLDDPTGDLPAVDREAVWTVVDGRRRDGGTTVLATGSVQEAIELCDRVALLRDGAVVDVGRPARIAEEHFPIVVLHLRVEQAPDAALLRDLPEVVGLDVEERPGHWIVRLDTRQPDALRRLLDADPDFPDVATAEIFSAEDGDDPETDEATDG